jgi:competence protein ComEA
MASLDRECCTPDISGVTEATNEAGVRAAAPAPKGRLDTALARARQSVWLAASGKLAGLVVVLGALGTIGVVSTLHGKTGHAVPNDFRSHALASARVVSSTAPVSASSRDAARSTLHPPGSPPPVDGERERTPAVLADGKVVLNLATVEDLMKVPGIGQKRAEQIIQLRSKLGRFRRLTELRRVKGIGPKRLQKMLPSLVLDAPKADHHDAGAAAPKPPSQ